MIDSGDIERSAQEPYDNNIDSSERGIKVLWRAADNLSAIMIVERI